MAPLDILNNKKYDILDSIVEDVHKNCIRMDEEEAKALVERFQRVLAYFIKVMKEVDPVFNQVFNRIGFTGSYFDGLRIGEATEFDLNLILHPKLTIETNSDKCPAGFISLSLGSEEINKANEFKQWVTVVDSKILLNPTLVNNWLQGVMHRTLTKIGAETFNDCKIALLRKSGPAWTLVINSDRYPQKIIDVDFVPVLEFSCFHWPVRHRIDGIPRINETWFAVPKPPRSGHSISWRMSFPTQENALIKGLEYFKYTLRLLKNVRDKFGFKAIASYYIKTLFLWELEEQDRSIWVKRRRGRLFIYMLKRLEEALAEEKIPFFWDEDCNLIEHISSKSLKNFRGRLKNFMKETDKLIDRLNSDGKIERDYYQLVQFFKVQLIAPRVWFEGEVDEEKNLANEPFIVVFLVILVILGIFMALVGCLI